LSKWQRGLGVLAAKICLQHFQTRHDDFASAETIIGYDPYGGIAWSPVCGLQHPSSRRLRGREPQPCRDPATQVERSNEVGGMSTREKPYSVLIADDDPQARETLREIVEPEGYRALLASSGEEALDIVREEPVHVALFDMHMRHLTGLETVQLVHQINSVLPCILVTADATEDLMREAFSVRAYSVIPKPVSRNMLLYTMVRALMKVYGDMLRKGRDN
jgi:CheY-like chemotaxis protein